MDEVSRLIGAFKEEDIEKLEHPDFSSKPDIIMDLEDIEDKRILPFFLDVILDKQEFDLARVEVLEILAIRDFTDAAEREKAGEAVRQVLVSEDDDYLVRQYAGIAIANYMDVDNVIEDVEKAIFNPREDIAVRSSAFTAIEKMGPTSRSIGIMKRLLDDIEFGKSASRILNQWDVN